MQAPALVGLGGTCCDLNPQTDPGHGITLRAATAIDGQGQIAVIGSYAGTSDHTNIILLTPSA